MKTNGKRTRRDRSGFSMIEVLVASTILVVIVMMLAMLFQQTSLAWRTGVRRAKSFMQVRSALGAMQRDASAAIDARYLTNKVSKLIGDGEQVFDGELKFYTLRGTGFEKDDINGVPLRALSYITYNTSGQRTETVLDANGDAYLKGDSNVLKIETGKDQATATIEAIKPTVPAARPTDPAGNPLPLFVTVKVRVDYAGKSYDIGARSLGPDMKPDTDDDIKTWVK